MILCRVKEDQPNDACRERDIYKEGKAVLVYFIVLQGYFDTILKNFLAISILLSSYTTSTLVQVHLKQIYLAIKVEILRCTSRFV
jgi:hypothetical protein